MADGTQKPIERVEIGDAVLGFDATTRARMSSTVLAVHNPRVVDHYFVINDRLRVSETQPLLSGRGWVHVADLEIGDALIDKLGLQVPIHAIDRIDAQTVVYNLDVDNDTYISNGVVAHNKKEHYLIFHPEHQ